MKAKTVTKKALSLMLSVLMIFSVFSIGFTASAECGHPKLKENGWTVTSNATCSASGTKKQWCPDCGTDVVFLIPMDPEAHILGPWETLKVHTCTTTGTDVRRCTECKEILQTRTVPAHDYTVLYGDKATCVTDGYELVMCSTCYEMKTNTLLKDSSLHSFGDWMVLQEATCETEEGKSGIRVRYCSNFDENGVRCTAEEYEYYTDKNNHADVTWHYDQEIAPTCDKSGVLPGTCNDCGEEVEEILPRHSKSPYIVTDTLPATCHSEGIEYRYCDCGLYYEVAIPVDENNHTYSDWLISKEPGCVNGTRFKYCLYHSEVKIEEDIPANGEHHYGEWIVDIEPDCSKTGIRHKSCADCDKTIYEELPTAHDYAKWDVISEMRCDEIYAQSGIKRAYCDACNYTKDFVVPVSHNFGGWTIRFRADCKTGNVGEKYRRCSVCGLEETVTYTVEHEFTKWVAKDKPVCDVYDSEGNLVSKGRTGTYERYCMTCKKVETKSIPTTHEFVDWEIESYATCTSSGKKVGVCKFCGIEKEELIKADHVYSEWEVVTEPGCKSQGVEKRKCFICSSEETRYLDVAHDFGDWWPVSGTIDCNSSASVLAKRTCKKCGVSTDATYISSKHPNLRTAVIEPTCVKTGYTMESCADCGYSRVYDYVAETGHTLDEKWTTRLQATCSTPGAVYKACADCDYLEFVEIEKLNHKLIELEPGVDPTCTEEGKSPVSFCSECKQKFESVVVPALGHDYGEEGEICIRCYVYKESDNCACACHSTSGIESIVFMVISKLYQMLGINQVCKCGDLHYEEVGFLAKLFGKG